MMRVAHLMMAEISKAEDAELLMMPTTALPLTTRRRPTTHQLSSVEALMIPINTRTPILTQQSRHKRSHDMMYSPMDDVYDNQIKSVVRNRKKPKSYNTGQNHWIPFRTSRNKPILMVPATNAKQRRDNEQEIIRFITYCMFSAPGINKWATVTTYISHVKHLHKEAMFDSSLAPFRWPSLDDITRIGIYSNIAQDWFKDTYQPSGGRLPMTVGVAQMLYEKLDMSTVAHRNFWLILLIDMMGGTRTGELVAYVKDPALRNTRDTKKLFRREAIIFGTHQMEVKVLGKTSGEIEYVIIPHTEVNEIVEKFGAHFDVVKFMHEEIDGQDLQRLTFIDENGAAYTYNNFMEVLHYAIKQAGLPKGWFGGHSGRIRLASMLGARKETDSFIKKRGRWVSDTFLTYIRSLHVHNPNETRLISFRIADLAVDLRHHGFPDVYEFQK